MAAAGLAGAVGPAPDRERAEQPLVVLDAADHSIEARTTIRIHAPPATVWAVLSSCSEAVKIVPGLEVCEVRESAPDQSWERIRQVMTYARFLPKMSYEVRVSYLKPDRIAFERISGDLITLRGSWVLVRDGEYTVARYLLDFEPDFWAPRWIVRAALKRDLPKMLRALRANAESAAAKNLG